MRALLRKEVAAYAFVSLPPPFRCTTPSSGAKNASDDTDERQEKHFAGPPEKEDCGNKSGASRHLSDEN